MSSPQEIQRDIEQTRTELSGNVDRLTEKVSPGGVARRRVDKIKGGAASVRDRVMGSASEGSGLRGADDSVSSVAADAKDTLASAPQTVRSQTQGNPLAAGLVAFGLGMVLSSLAPPSSAERQLASNAEAKAKDLAEPVKEAGQQIAQDLKQPVQDAVDQVKSTAQDAAQHTTEQAKSAAQDVKAPLQQ
jgi:gas vesicle protein